jgi:hypothetical protein
MFFAGFATAAVIAAALWFAFVRTPGATPQQAAEPPHRALVRSHLRDPGSADFGPERKSTRHVNVWCGSVNSRNGFGGMTGQTRYVAIVAAGEVTFDEPPGRAEPNSDLAARFNGRWHLYCE